MVFSLRNVAVLLFTCMVAIAASAENDPIENPDLAAFVQCVEDLRQKAEGCREGIHAIADDCLVQIDELLELEDIEGAIAAAEKCLEDIELERDACIAALVDECKACVIALEELEVDERLIADLLRKCEWLGHSVGEAAHHSARRIEEALDDILEDDIDDGAEDCLRELRRIVHACNEYTFKVARDCVIGIHELRDEGNEEGATALAQECAEEINTHVDECIRVVEEHCATCLDELFGDADKNDDHFIDWEDEFLDACEGAIEHIIDVEEKALEAIRRALDDDSDETSAEAFAQECLHELREHTHGCVEEMSRVLINCLEEIRALLDGGNEEDARALAKRCISRIEDIGDECASNLASKCEECVAILLERYDDEKLARRLKAVCTELVMFVESAQRRAIQAIKSEFGEDEPDAAEEYAHECAEAIREEIERCVHALIKKAEECGDEIEELLEEGDVEGARDVYEECESAIFEITDTCIESLRVHCDECTDVLLNDFGSEVLANRLAEFCEDQAEFLHNAGRRVLAYLKSQFDDDTNPRECLRELREITKEYVGRNHRIAVHCAIKILVLLEEGAIDAAHDLADECIDKLSQNTREGAQEIREHCVECLEALTDAPVEKGDIVEEPDIIPGICRDHLDFLFQSEQRAAHLIRLALNSEDLPDDVELGDRGFEPLVDGDCDHDGRSNAIDIQFVINRVLNAIVPGFNRYDHDGDNEVNAADIQKVINATLGL